MKVNIALNSHAYLLTRIGLVYKKGKFSAIEEQQLKMAIQRYAHVSTFSREPGSGKLIASCTYPGKTTYCWRIEREDLFQKRQQQRYRILVRIEWVLYSYHHFMYSWHRSFSVCCSFTTNHSCISPRPSSLSPTQTAGNMASSRRRRLKTVCIFLSLVVFDRSNLLQSSSRSRSTVGKSQLSCWEDGFRLSRSIQKSYI